MKHPLFAACALLLLVGAGCHEKPKKIEQSPLPSRSQQDLPPLQEEELGDPEQNVVTEFSVPEPIAGAEETIIEVVTDNVTTTLTW